MTILNKSEEVFKLAFYYIEEMRFCISGEINICLFLSLFLISLVVVLLRSCREVPNFHNCFWRTVQVKNVSSPHVHYFKKPRNFIAML